MRKENEKLVCAECGLQKITQVRRIVFDPNTMEICDVENDYERWCNNCEEEGIRFITRHEYEQGLVDYYKHCVVNIIGAEPSSILLSDEEILEKIILHGLNSDDLLNEANFIYAAKNNKY